MQTPTGFDVYIFSPKKIIVLFQKYFQTKPNKTKENRRKQSKTKQNKTKQNKTKQNKTKQCQVNLCRGAKGPPIPSTGTITKGLVVAPPSSSI